MKKRKKRDSSKEKPELTFWSDGSQESQAVILALKMSGIPFTLRYHSSGAVLAGRYFYECGVSNIRRFFTISRLEEFLEKIRERRCCPNCGHDLGGMR